MALYGVYLAEQVLLSMAPTLAESFRLVTLAVVVPAVLVFLAWQVIAWREQRARG